jgi:hypothetical protein
MFWFKFGKTALERQGTKSWLTVTSLSVKSHSLTLKESDARQM